MDDSTDAIHWTRVATIRDTDFQFGLSSVAYGGGQWVAASSGFAARSATPGGPPVPGVLRVFNDAATWSPVAHVEPTVEVLAFGGPPLPGRRRPPTVPSASPSGTAVASVIPSNTATRSAGGPCVVAALPATLDADNPARSSTFVVAAGTIKCDGAFAVGAAINGGAREQITVLWHRDGRSWQRIDRSVYCADGEIPSGLLTLACKSN